MSATKQRGRGRPPGSGKRPVQSSTTLTTTADLQDSASDSFSFKDKFSSSWSNPNSGELTNKSRRSKSLGWDEGEVDEEGEGEFDFGGFDYGSFDLYDEHGQGLGPELSQDQKGNHSMDVENGEELDIILEEPSEEKDQEEDKVEAKAEDEEVDEIVEEAEEGETFELGAVGIRSALQVIARAGVVSGKVEGGPWTEEELHLLEQVRIWAPVQDLEKAFSALLEQKDLLVKK